VNVIIYRLAEPLTRRGREGERLFEMKSQRRRGAASFRSFELLSLSAIYLEASNALVALLPFSCNLSVAHRIGKAEKREGGGRIEYCRRA